MKLTSHLPPAERDRVEGRLHSNLIAWLTTVRPDGQPVTVPVWFLLRDDETILLYSRPEKDKLRNIAANPKVSFALDVTDIGRNIVRLEGTARRAHDQPPANEHPAYLVKYTERLGAMFGTPEQFAALFSAALIITPAKLHTREPPARAGRAARPAHVEVVAQPGRHRGADVRHTAWRAQKPMICVPGPAPHEHGPAAHTRQVPRGLCAGSRSAPSAALRPVHKIRRSARPSSSLGAHRSGAKVWSIWRAAGIRGAGCAGACPAGFRGRLWVAAGASARSAEGVTSSVAGGRYGRSCRRPRPAS